GSAVDTMVWSKAASNTTSMREENITPRRGVLSSALAVLRFMPDRLWAWLYLFQACARPSMQPWCRALRGTKAGAQTSRAGSSAGRLRCRADGLAGNRRSSVGEHGGVPALHFFGRNLFDAVADQPAVAERIPHAAGAFAVEVIRGLPLQAR